MLARSAIPMALLLMSAELSAQQREPTAEDRARWAREAEERTHNDWAWLARYREENSKLAPTPGAPRIVFLADSITEDWRSMGA